MQEKENLVFLDIDGVINTIQIKKKPFDSSKGYYESSDFYMTIAHEEDLYIPNEQAIEWLNKLCVETNAKVVISSTWRFNMEDTIESLHHSGFLSQIPILGGTPKGVSGVRGAEITEYLKNLDNEKEIHYVILDDDADMGVHSDHLVQVNTYHGFGYPEFIQAIETMKK